MIKKILYIIDEKDRNLMPFVVSKRHKKTYQRTQNNKIEKNNTLLKSSNKKDCKLHNHYRKKIKSSEKFSELQ